jgi:hypothetical protein
MEDFVRSLRCLLCFACSVVLAGCITVDESKSERGLVESFSGDPRIAGAYSSQGQGQQWNGSSFQDIRGNLGYLFRDESQRLGYKCDAVVFRREDDGTLTVQFESNRGITHSLHFVAGPNYTESARWVSIKIKRAPDSDEITERVELLLALDKSGMLRVLERTDIEMMTGVGIPLVPVRAKEVSSYSFAPTIPHP